MIKELLAERCIPEIPESREEIKEILQREIYGYMPEGPSELTFSEKVIEMRFPCGAELKEITCSGKVMGKEFSFPFKAALHTDGKKRPFFVNINFHSDVPDLYQPTEEILDNGFDVLSFGYKDVTSDDGDFTNGLADVFVGGNKRGETTCGKIIIWAWAAMRAMDYAETQGCLDLENAAVVGHSRLGKTALVAGMFDKRFKYVISNDSGCSGAAITRGKVGEQVANITKSFPYWFCENYKKYVDKHYEMPFDQHFLLAASAPRYVYVASATNDEWADPVSEYLCCYAVSEYFKDSGGIGFCAKDRLPEAGDVFHSGNIGYHLREGAHFFSRYDWQRYMEFVKSKIE